MKIVLAGLLARSAPDRPSRRALGPMQWHGESGDLYLPLGAGEPYSYGDSAGLAPDFPFNSAPAAAGAKTNYAANVRGKSIPAGYIRKWAGSPTNGAGKVLPHQYHYALYYSAVRHFS